MGNMYKLANATERLRIYKTLQSAYRDEIDIVLHYPTTHYNGNTIIRPTSGICNNLKVAYGVILDTLTMLDNTNLLNIFPEFRTEGFKIKEKGRDINGYWYDTPSERYDALERMIQNIPKEINNNNMRQPTIEERRDIYSIILSVYQHEDEYEMINISGSTKLENRATTISHTNGLCTNLSVCYRNRIEQVDITQLDLLNLFPEFKIERNLQEQRQTTLSSYWYRNRLERIGAVTRMLNNIPRVNDSEIIIELSPGQKVIFTPNEYKVLEQRILDNHITKKVEEPIDNRPKTWEEAFNIIKPNCYINEISTIKTGYHTYSTTNNCNHNMISSEIKAKSILATSQLMTICDALNKLNESIDGHHYRIFYIKSLNYFTAAQCDNTVSNHIKLNRREDAIFLIKHYSELLKQYLMIS